MKRYLIYGFLTILIITLNFAFIIVLITDDVRINYRVLFFLWIVVLLAAGGLAYLEKTRRGREKMASAAAEKAARKQFLKQPEEEEEEEKKSTSNFYKHKCIKKVKIKLPEDRTKEVKQGFFSGYLVNENYANEIVQAVYTSQEQLLGFISKKHEQLCENLELLYNDPVVCWGNINWDDHDKRYIAKIFIPILYSEPETNRFKNMVKLKEELTHLTDSSEDYSVYTILDKAENLYYLQQSEAPPASLQHSIDPEILSGLGKKLEKTKSWEELRKLKKYPIVISHMPPTEKRELLSSIQKAEKNQKAKP